MCLLTLENTSDKHSPELTFFLRRSRLARAGSALVATQEAAREPSAWEKMKTNSPVFAYFQDLKERYDESESPVVSALRAVTSRIGALSDENEFAQVTRMMRALDPGFDVEGFTGDLREYIIPELLDAYLGADKEALKQWCGEAVRFPCRVSVARNH